MSRNKHYRDVWAGKVYKVAVELFHTARKTDEERGTPLAVLARKCANSAFADYQHTIIGDKEICSRVFMDYCRENFDTEVQKARAELALLPPEPEPQEARVM